MQVVDGDTYVFPTQNGSFIVKLYGIDATERDQPFCKESSEFLSKYLNKAAINKINGTERY